MFVPTFFYVDCNLFLFFLSYFICIWHLTFRSLYLYHTHAAKGRTNIELREQFILADGVSQSMTAFKPKTSASTPGSGSSANSLRTPTAGPITKVLIMHIINVNIAQKSKKSPTKQKNCFNLYSVSFFYLTQLSIRLI